MSKYIDKEEVIKFLEKLLENFPVYGHQVAKNIYSGLLSRIVSGEFDVPVTEEDEIPEGMTYAEYYHGIKPKDEKTK